MSKVLLKFKNWLADETPTYHAGTLTYTRKSLIALFFWLFAGDACYVLMESVVPSVLPLKFQRLGASNAVIGLIVTTIPSVINSVINPIVSFRSDRYRSRWGRRIPFIFSTLPLLVICLVATGYSENIGLWIYHRIIGPGAHMSVRTVEIAAIGVFMCAFTVFNAFLNAVFWYLFNDVVPEHLLARFMSCFRLISMFTSSAYNMFIFKYADMHAPEIAVGVAILYVVGFGGMCLKVKEGRYPPPAENIGGRSDVISSVKTWAIECHGLAHYRYYFFSTFAMGLVWGTNVFLLYLYQSTGLNLAQIGQVTGVAGLVTGLVIPVSGWLADRYHPIRIYLAGRLIILLLVYPLSLCWLFWHPGARAAFWVWMVIIAGFQGIGQGMDVGAPMIMRLYPRSRYGQFCSANAVWNMLGGITGSALGGAFLDSLKRYVPGGMVYRYLPAWQLTFAAASFGLLVCLYLSWKRYGGDDHYLPPLPGETAHPDEKPGMDIETQLPAPSEDPELATKS